MIKVFAPDGPFTENNIVMIMRVINVFKLDVIVYQANQGQIQQLKDAGISGSIRTRKMICKKCGTPMVIDEWGGWKWTCFHCDFVDRVATDQEIKQFKAELKNIREDKESD